VAGKPVILRAMDHRPIGFLDSGVGGLSLLSATKRLLPNERCIFLADGRYFPYGESDPASICNRAASLGRFLVARDAKLIVVACNTASVHALGYLRSVFPEVPFVGVVPVVKTLAQRTQSGTIAILSTPSTAGSPYMAGLLDQFAAGLNVVNIGCPGLAEAVECGEARSGETEAHVEQLLRDLPATGTDVLGLGCTHYYFLRPALKSILGSSIRIFDPSRPVARRVRQVLQEHAALVQKRAGEDAFFTTGDPARFACVAGALLRRPIAPVKAVDIV
jgi:glutamate racemase